MRLKRLEQYEARMKEQGLVESQTQCKTSAGDKALSDDDAEWSEGQEEIDDEELSTDESESSSSDSLTEAEDETEDEDDVPVTSSRSKRSCAFADDEAEESEHDADSETGDNENNDDSDSESNVEVRSVSSKSVDSDNMNRPDQHSIGCRSGALGQPRNERHSRFDKLMDLDDFTDLPGHTTEVVEENISAGNYRLNSTRRPQGSLGPGDVDLFTSDYSAILDRSKITNGKQPRPFDGATNQTGHVEAYASGLDDTVAVESSSTSQDSQQVHANRHELFASSKQSFNKTSLDGQNLEEKDSQLDHDKRRQLFESSELLSTSYPDHKSPAGRNTPYDVSREHCASLSQSLFSEPSITRGGTAPPLSTGDEFRDLTWNESNVRFPLSSMDSQETAANTACRQTDSISTPPENMISDHASLDEKTTVDSDEKLKKTELIDSPNQLSQTRMRRRVVLLDHDEDEDGDDSEDKFKFPPKLRSLPGLNAIAKSEENENKLENAKHKPDTTSDTDEKELTIAGDVPYIEDEDDDVDNLGVNSAPQSVQSKEDESADDEVPDNEDESDDAESVEDEYDTASGDTEEASDEEVAQALALKQNMPESSEQNPKRIRKNQGMLRAFAFMTFCDRVHAHEKPELYLEDGDLYAEDGKMRERRFRWRGLENDDPLADASGVMDGDDTDGGSEDDDTAAAVSRFGPMDRWLQSAPRGSQGPRIVPVVVDGETHSTDVDLDNMPNPVDDSVLTVSEERENRQEDSNSNDEKENRPTQQENDSLSVLSLGRKAVLKAQTSEAKIVIQTVSNRKTAANKASFPKPVNPPNVATIARFFSRQTSLLTSSSSCSQLSGRNTVDHISPFHSTSVGDSRPKLSKCGSLLNRLPVSSMAKSTMPSRPSFVGTDDVDSDVIVVPEDSDLSSVIGVTAAGRRNSTGHFFGLRNKVGMSCFNILSQPESGTNGSRVTNQNLPLKARSSQQFTPPFETGKRASCEPIPVNIKRQRSASVFSALM
ncbi:hypothetical protein FGIG_08277 [Fasciola gigantica]|uniref:Claspin n=1 Tax=Fasciola gigantica TaxID=46835 RepID=A0A504YSV0_FASGI|nr:hypothetical protein FGIG_08277 [Fasciola gigantica]